MKETRRLYNVLAQRAMKSRIFLPRNLLRCNERPRRTGALQNVNYRSTESGVSWQTTRNDLRCLWCKSNFFRFANPNELLNHLVTCHGMLQYSLENSESRDPRVHVIVNVSIVLIASFAANSFSFSITNRGVVFLMNFAFCWETLLFDRFCNCR